MSNKGDKTLAESLRARAKRVRDQNPNWIVDHPNVDRFYIARGYFPTQTDFLPTRLSITDIIQN
jgi:hypothetical protein